MSNMPKFKIGDKVIYGYGPISRIKTSIVGYDRNCDKYIIVVKDGWELTSQGGIDLHKPYGMTDFSKTYRWVYEDGLTHISVCLDCQKFGLNMYARTYVYSLKDKI